MSASLFSVVKAEWKRLSSFSLFSSLALALNSLGSLNYLIIFEVTVPLASSSSITLSELSFESIMMN